MKKIKVENEGHDAFGNLICKFGVDSVEEVIKIFNWIGKNHIGGLDTVDSGPDGVYTNACDFRLYPYAPFDSGLNYEDWEDKDDKEDSNWNTKIEKFNQRHAMMYFTVQFEDYNLEEDLESGEESISLKMWNKLVASFENDKYADTTAALKCEDLAMKYIGQCMTDLLLREE
jgi:hypothetical protein